MHYTLDEMFDPDAARILDLAGTREGDTFTYILDFADESIDDEDIPEVCGEVGIDVLVTVNHKDFGAKKAVYQTLINQGVHVVVLRPQKLKMYTENQVAFVLQGYRAMRTEFADSDPKGPRILLRVGLGGGVVRRSLEDLVAEFEAGRDLP